MRKDGLPDMRYKINREWVKLRQNDPALSNGAGNDRKPPELTSHNAERGIVIPTPEKNKEDKAEEIKVEVKKEVEEEAIGENENLKKIKENKLKSEKVNEEETKHTKETGENVKFGLVNTRSLVNTKLDKEKVKKFKKLASNLDIISVTETWFTSTDPNESNLIEACPDGFIPVHEPRVGRRGGGVAIFYRDTIKLAHFSTVHYSSFEHLDFSLTVGSNRLRIINIYRPPANSKDKFLEEFKNLLNELSGDTEKLLISGDFNLNMVNPDKHDKKFLKLIKLHGIVQHVDEPTHEKKGILDLILSRQSDDSSFAEDVRIGDYFSDHRIVQCLIKV